MISLRRISHDDLDTVFQHTEMSLKDIETIIENSDSKSFHNHFFEMYVVLSESEIVGFISLFEHSLSVVSIGPEIFEECRKRGYATKAMQKAMDIAQSNGYRIVFQQIRTDNAASIRLHKKLGFETNNMVFKNGNNNDVFLYLKSL